MKLAQQVAVITGAGQGIGREVARKLAAEGARIVVNDLDAAAAQAVASELCLLGSQAVDCAGDVTAAGVPEACIERALQAWGRLDIVVNNAGHPWDATIQNTSDEQFRHMLDLHVVAPFRMLRAAAEPFRRQAREDDAEAVAPVRRREPGHRQLGALAARPAAGCRDGAGRFAPNSRPTSRSTSRTPTRCASASRSSRSRSTSACPDSSARCRA